MSTCSEVPPYYGLLVSVPCRKFSTTSSLPGLAASYNCCFVSGPPGPSKSRALVGLLGALATLQSSNPCTFCMTYCPAPPFSPGFRIRSPLSSTGISRLSPWPEAWEPVLTTEPGNLAVTPSLTPDSVSIQAVSDCGFCRKRQARTRQALFVAVLSIVGIEVTLGLLRDD